jgi:hypothetical protein
MYGIFVLIVLGLVSWWALSPGRRFQSGFARLVERARTHWGFEGGRLTTFVTGTYRGRPLTLQLFHPAGGEDSTNAPGQVVLTMQVRAGESAAWKSSLANFNDPELSRATFDLEGRYGLRLTLQDASLQAAWTPPPGRLFPGAFDEQRWRNTLAQMHVVAGWLERREGQEP